MSGIEPAALPQPELVQALRAGAQDDKRVQAAIELLIRHDVWLQRPAFLATCVRVTPQPTGSDGLSATIDWRKAARLAELAATTATDRRVLRVAATLGGAPRRVDVLARRPGIGSDMVERSPWIGDGRPG